MEVNILETDKIEHRNKVAKPLVWFGIVGMVMLFAGFTSAYIVRQAEGDWLVFSLPDAFYYSTVFIVISSITFIIGKRGAAANNRKLMIGGLGATLALGIAFVISQFSGWNTLTEQGVFFAGRQSNASGSFFYVLTGMHLVHLAGGIIALTITFIKALRGKYSSTNMLGIEVCGIYWHFLDILWIYLMLFLIYIR